MQALDLTPPIPAVITTLVATNLGMALPSAPAYIGVYHYLSVLALQPFAIEQEIALGYAVVAHVVIFGSFIVAGIAAVWWELGAIPSVSSLASIAQGRNRVRN